MYPTNTITPSLTKTPTASANPTNTSTPTITPAPTELSADSSFEKYSIFFPERLSSESETSFLKGIHLSQGVMEKTGVESLHISPEKMNNIGKFYLGLLAWMQRINVPEYRFGYPAVAGGGISADKFTRMIESYGIKTPVVIQPLGPKYTFRASEMEIHLVTLSEYESILNYYDDTNEKIINFHELLLGKEPNGGLRSRTLIILDENGILKFFQSSNYAMSYSGDENIWNFEIYEKPRSPNEIFMDFSEQTLNYLAFVIESRFDPYAGPIPGIRNDGVFQRFLGCDKYYNSKPVDCSQAAEEIFTFSK
jgi:hypothetical protein